MQRHFPGPLVFFVFPALLAACDSSDGQKQAASPPVAVKTIAMAAEDIALHKEYPGRLVPVRLAEVRARVTGIVLKRVFFEGTDVKAGDVLFQIDPEKFQATVAAMKAQLARAEAALVLAGQQAGRAEALLPTNAISKDRYEIALASRQQTTAEVSLAKANLQTAELELGYASVRSPINGRIGAALVTEGAFVRQEDGTQMATVRDLSSVYVDFTAPLADLTQVKQDIASGAPGSADASHPVELITSDGKTFGEPGRLIFSSAVVNETTGQVSLRAAFSNPGHTLLPGAYVRVRMLHGVSRQVVLTPHRAVQWDSLGQARVMTVQDGKAVAQPVVASRSVGNRWLVSQGLRPGDQVIVDGADKAMPGSPVAAQPVDGERAASKKRRDDCASCDPQPKL